MRGIKKFAGETDLIDGGIDAGLLLLSALPGEIELSLSEIAFVCGCNPQDIWHIENRAKRKLKTEFLKRGVDANFL